MWNNAVRTGGRRLGGMTHRAFVQCPGMPLQRDKFDTVIGLTAGCDGVRAVVARCAVNVAVAFRQTIQGLILGVAAAVTCNAITARLVQPG